MTYKELIYLYKNGKLSAEQKLMVEGDIERQEAISEYLFDNSGIPEFSELEIQTDGKVEADEKNFVRMVNKSVRRAFFRMGLGITAVLVAVLLVLSVALPHIVDACYYNPAEIVGECEGVKTNRLTLDTSVYTELFTPGYFRTKAEVFSEGYGDYDICIPQNFSNNGRIKDVYGTVDKGRLTMFSGDLFRLPEANVFVPEDIWVHSTVSEGQGSAGSKEDALRKLQSLDESDYYIGYVTLKEVMSYEKFTEWCETEGVTPDWCAVCEKEKSRYQINLMAGFNYLADGNSMVYDSGSYPYLSFADVLETRSEPSEAVSPEVMQTHMVSMLRYMQTREEFREMVGSVASDSDYENLAENIEENGLNIYGFAIVAQKNTLLQLSEMKAVHYISTEYLN